MSRRRKTSKAAISSTDSIASVVSLNASRLPELDVYWLLFMKHPWVASCVNLIANTIAADGFTVQATRGNTAVDAAKDPRVAEIEEFFDIAFPGKTFYGAMLATTIDLDVFGKSYWRKLRVGGKLVGITRIDPRLLVPKINDDRTQITGYMLYRKRGISEMLSGGEAIDAKDIVFFRRSGGDELLGAPAPLEHLDLTIAIDLAIRRFRESFFRNGATPGKIIGLQGANGSVPTRDQAREIKAQINDKRGPENAFTTWVIPGDITVADRTSESSGGREVDFVKGSGLNREEICGVYHVPVGKLSFSSNALGSSGKAEDDATFQEQCVLPREECIYATITRDVLVAEFEIDDLEMVPRRRHSLRLDMFEAAVQLVQFGGTGNEARDLVNLPRSESATTDMDVPLFLESHAQALSDVEPLKPTAQSAVGDANENIDEVAQKGAKRFRAY